MAMTLIASNVYLMLRLRILNDVSILSTKRMCVITLAPDVTPLKYRCFVVDELLIRYIVCLAPILEWQAGGDLEVVHIHH